MNEYKHNFSFIQIYLDPFQYMPILMDDYIDGNKLSTI